MYTSRKFYPSLVCEHHPISVTYCVSEGDVVTFLSENKSASERVEFNPNYKVISADSFTIDSVVKSGSPLTPSPVVRVMDMTLSDRANQVFNSKIVKK